MILYGVCFCKRRMQAGRLSQPGNYGIATKAVGKYERNCNYSNGNKDCEEEPSKYELAVFKK